MGIDYRKEVDSGKDRKLMVEHVIFELAKRGIPTEEIEKDPNFIKFKHSELLRNISRGYASKLEQFEELYGGFYEEPKDGLGEDYSKLFHGMKELYPMTPQEEKELFTKRIKLLEEIENDQKLYEKKLIKDRDKIINKIAKFKVKYPIIDKIIDLTSEMDELQEQGKLNGVTMEALFKKYGIEQKRFAVVNSIYREYMEIMTEFDVVNDNILNVQKGLLHSPEYMLKNIEVERVTEEIISRNIKLINYFIRSQYSNLLVDQGELFSICLEGLYSALKEFNPSKGKFSTFAFTGMNFKVHQEFKNLTGYSWEDYWNKQKINKLIEIVSEMLGRTATIVDLVELGLIDLSYKRALDIQNLPVFLLESYVYGEPEPNEQLVDPEFDPSLLKDEWEDNRYANSYSDEDEYTNIGEISMLTDQMVNIIYELSDRERIVLVLAFGLNPFKYLHDYERQYLDIDDVINPWFLDDIGAKIHLSSERVRQIREKALRRLRHPKYRHQIEDFCPKV